MHRLLAAMIVLFLAGCTNGPSQRSVVPQEPQTATVTRIFDGDTIVVQTGDGTEERVRLIGIDTPEYDAKDKAFDCFGAEAKDFLAERIGDQEVTLHRNPYGDDHDKYGRLLRYVEIEGTDIGAELLGGGYAEDFPWFPHPRIKAYRRLEAAAKEGKRGQWDSCQKNGQGDSGPK